MSTDTAPAQTPTQAASELLERTRATARGGTLPARVAAARQEGPLVAALLAFLGFGGVLALVRRRRTEAIDAAVTMKLQALRYPRLASLLSAVSWAGFPPQSRVIPPAIIGSWWLLRFRPEAWTQLLAWGPAGLSSVIKIFMQRARPVAGTDLRVVAAPLGGTSFPSGHVLAYLGTYGWLAILTHSLVRRVWPRRIAVTALGSLVTLVGPSRIYLGHHWATDVLASYLLGSGYLLGLGWLYRRLKQPQNPPASP